MVPMPAAIVLIVCKTVVAGPPDQNAEYTKAENREWATEHAMMVCRREEVQMYDRAVDGGADPQAFNAQRCQRSAMMLGPQWDASHQSSSYRFWRVACPVPIVRKNDDGSEDIIAWKLPDCGHRDTVVCEVDTAISDFSVGPSRSRPDFDEVK
jgi:hypothetical protein